MLRTAHCATLLSAVVALACAPAALAQPDKPWKSWFPHVAVQYTLPQGEAGDALDDGWGLAGGVTYKPEGWKIGIPIELGFTENDIDRGFLESFVDGPPPDGLAGDAQLWNLTGGVMWQTNTAGPVDFYLNANLGAYYTDVEVRVPAGVAWVPGYCGWYWCVPGGVVPVDAVQSDSSWDFGGNLGIGLAFALNDGSQIYIEAKYQYADTPNESTTWVPIQVGYRW